VNATVPTRGPNSTLTTALTQWAISRSVLLIYTVCGFLQSCS